MDWLFWCSLWVATWLEQKSVTLRVKVAVLTKAGVNLVFFTQRGNIVQQMKTHLRLGPLTLGTGSKLRKLSITLRDDLNQILFSAIVYGRVLLEPFFTRRFSKWLVVDQGRLLEHHLIGCVDLYDFVCRARSLFSHVSVVKLKYSAVWHGLWRCGL